MKQRQMFDLYSDLSLRATQGFLASARELMALTLPIPDYSTIACDYTIKFFTLGIRV